MSGTTRHKVETRDAVLSLMDEYPDAVWWVRWMYPDSPYWEPIYEHDDIKGWEPSYCDMKAFCGDIEVELPDGVEP